MKKILSFITSFVMAFCLILKLPIASSTAEGILVRISVDSITLTLNELLMNNHTVKVPVYIDPTLYPNVRISSITYSFKSSSNNYNAPDKYTVQDEGVKTTKYTIYGKQKLGDIIIKYDSSYFRKDMSYPRNKHEIQLRVIVNDIQFEKTDTVNFAGTKYTIYNGSATITDFPGNTITTSPKTTSRATTTTTTTTTTSIKTSTKMITTSNTTQTT